MKLGFLTAALPDNTLEQAAQWGAESGFQAIEIACWPLGKATRRYAGVTHIDVSTLDKAKAREIRKMLDGYGLPISVPGVLSQSAPPGRRTSRNGDRPPQKSYRGSRPAGNPGGGYICWQR